MEKNLKNKKTIKNILIILVVLITAGAILTSAAVSCKKKTDTTLQTTSDITEVQNTTESIQENTSPSEDTALETIPPQILALIDEAETYFDDGEYGLAKNAYRKAEIAINNSSLSESKKAELVNSFYDNFEKSKDIIEASSLHFANAMQLIYETRYEEAKKELEIALELYPKYKEALEAYENLKTLMGLK